MVVVTSCTRASWAVGGPWLTRARAPRRCMQHGLLERAEAEALLQELGKKIK